MSMIGMDPVSHRRSLPQGAQGSRSSVATAIAALIVALALIAAGLLLFSGGGDPGEPVEPLPQQEVTGSQ